MFGKESCVISVAQASQFIANIVKPNFQSERVPLVESLDRVLDQTVVADRDQPPFDRVAMDGIAFYLDFSQKNNRFKKQAIQAAGEPAKKLVGNEFCIEVMTGTGLPLGCNCVVPYEHIQDGGDFFDVPNIQDCQIFQNIHRQGEDGKKGQVFDFIGQPIHPALLGLLANFGVSQVQVRKMPKILVLTTGSELVEVNENPLPHQIRKTNVYSILGLIKSQLGLEVQVSHLADNKLETVAALGSALEIYDFIILTGGVSQGKFDYVPSVLGDLNVEKVFHKIKQKPGKPLYFGFKNDTYIFGLPGNPVSSFMCCMKYVLPALKIWLGEKSQAPTKAILNKDIDVKKSMTFFKPIKLSTQEGHWIADPIQGSGSGDLVSLVFADAFVELPEGKEDFKKGESYSIYRWDKC